MFPSINRLRILLLLLFGLLGCAPLGGVSVVTIQLAAASEDPPVLIAPEIYGHFAEHLGRCIYGGIWVGEESEIPNTRGIRNDVVDALRALEIPVLRWPGGCFADEYHWRDGIGPRPERPTMINTTWGGVVENNHFGTHEFFDLVELLGTKAYVAGNVGSGSPREMMEWVEYMTSPADTPLANLRRANGRDEPWRVEYFGVGNENWGCGGHMRAEYYADLYLRFSTFIKRYGEHPIDKIAGGANGGDLHWTDVLMDRAASRMDGVSVHYYTLPTGDWSAKGPATGFGEEEYLATLNNAWGMHRVLGEHIAIMDHHDPERRVGLMVDEWGIWTDVEPGTNRAFLYQQNSLRDAVVAALHFHFFHAYAERVRMANIAQTVNVLQAMILTQGSQMVRTPTYWVFEMFKVHQGGIRLPLDVATGQLGEGENTFPQISASATRDPETGTVHLSVINCHPSETAQFAIDLGDFELDRISGRILTTDAVDAHNTFGKPERVQPAPFRDVTTEGSIVRGILPAKSIVLLSLD